MNQITPSGETAARDRQAQIRLKVSGIHRDIEELSEIVTTAKESGDHLALGYPSWSAYLAETLGQEPMRLDRAERREVVALLAGEGMSTRAIAPVVGADQATVVRDRQVMQVASPGPGPAAPIEPTTPALVTGLDGKTYTQPAAEATRTPPRRALTDQFFDAAYDMGKAVEKVHRLTQDDRWTNNKAQVASKHEADLRQTADLLAEVIRSISTN